MSKPGLNFGRFIAMAFLLGFASGSWALSSPVGPLGLGAAVLGAGGAGVATATGADALGWNSAALATEGWNVGYGVGAGGVANSLNNALGIAGSLDEVGHVGLLLQDQRFGNFRESRLSGGIAVSAGPWLSIGTLQTLHSAEPGGLRGWSMDLGAAGRVPLGAGWGLRLGAAGTDLMSSLAWSNGLEEVQPSVLRLGAALEAAPGTWLALQQDRLDREGGAGSSQWRVGAQGALFEEHFFLRGGATQAQGSPLYYSAGLGGRLDLAGRQALEADYALLVPSSDAGGAALRHLLSMRWRFALPAPAPEAGLSRVLRHPQSGKLLHARIALAQAAPVDTQDWQLELKDKQGKVVKVFKGRGALPPSVAWDGRSDSGEVADTDGVSYTLRATDKGGRQLERHALLGLAPANANATFDADLAAVEGSSYGLRESTEAGPRPRVKPALKGGGGQLSVSAADFDLSSVQDEAATGWEMRIVDAEGKTVKRFSGQGRPPKNLRWAGTNDLGQPVETALGAGYVLRVTGADGTEKRVADELVAPEALSGYTGRPARSRHESACARDAARNELVCTLRFEADSADLDGDGEQTLQQVLRVLHEIPYKQVVIEGHADDRGSRDENYLLSQARADMAMKRLLEQGSSEVTSLISVGLADTRPQASNDSPDGRALNRRVELRFKDE